MLEEILGFRVESAGGERGQRLMEAARGPIENGVFPVGVISRVDRLILHDLRENLLRDRQLELVTTLSGAQVVEPLLLREGKIKKDIKISPQNCIHSARNFINLYYGHKT